MTNAGNSERESIGVMIKEDLDNDYKLIDFSISNNNIVFDTKNYEFKTKEQIAARRGLSVEEI